MAECVHSVATIAVRTIGYCFVARKKETRKEEEEEVNEKFVFFVSTSTLTIRSRIVN